MGDAKAKKCSSCGEAMEIGAAFCTNCGSRFMENANVKKCSSCGETIEFNDAFCTSCGSRFEEEETKGVRGISPIGTQLLELANDFLSVREVTPVRFEFSSQTGAQAPVQKVKIKYDAVAQLEPEKKQLTFWEQMVENSAGMNTGFSAERDVQKGIAVSQKIHGHLLFGGKYSFEYGKLREVVKAITDEQGWKFKTAISKPKRIMDTGGVESKKSIPLLKILVLVLALLLIIALGAIGYLYFSGRSKDMPPLVQQPTPTLSQKELKNVDPEDADKSNKINKIASPKRKALQKQGTIAGGKPLIENVDPEDADKSNKINKIASPEPKVLQKQGTIAEGKPLIEADRNIYNDGEEIRVHFYNAPGYSRDWICIVPAGSLDTEVGDYQYIPRQERGILTFKSPGPGQYEARAFYNYSPGRYVVSNRYSFTVQNR